MLDDYVVGEKCHNSQLGIKNFTSHTVRNNNTLDPDCAMAVSHPPFTCGQSLGTHATVQVWFGASTNCIKFVSSY